jgi:integrase
MLREIILSETKGGGVKPALFPDDTLTFRWFVQQRYIPMRQGSWSPAYKKTNTYQLDHYLVSAFGDLPLSRLDTFEIQIFLNGLAEKDYSEAVVRQCFNNIRAITKLAKRQKYLSEDPGEDTKMPQTKSAEKPVMLREQILSLIGAITDLHDLCLLYIGIFCGPRSSEVFGFQWASWNGESLTPLGTAYEGQLYVGRTKTKQSKAPISVPEQVRPVIEAWKAICPDVSPEALMFPTFGRGERKGQAVPRWGKNFLKWRIRPVTRARYSGSPRHLSGDAANSGDRYAASWNAQGHAGHPSACQHPHHGRCLCPDDRRKCAAGRELPHGGGTRWVRRAGRRHGSGRTQYQASGSNSAKFGEVARGGSCKLLILWLLR